MASNDAQGGSVNRRASGAAFQNARDFLYLKAIRMKARKFLAASVTVWAPVLVLLPLGCGKGGSSNTDVNPRGEAAHIAEAAGHVMTFMNENKGQKPTSTDELKDWVAQKGIAADSLVSTRDHEPYEIHETTMGGMGKQIMLVEKKGSRGKRFAFSPMNPTRLGMESTEEQIQTMLKGTEAATRKMGR
jgi:hypothetical protein